MERFYALGFDIERSGGGGEHATIALGAYVLDQDAKEHDRLLACCFVRDEVVFEQRCVDEFWSKPKHQALLNEIEAQTPKLVVQTDGTPTKPTQDEVELLATLAFVDFVAKWEARAEQEKTILYRTTDNAAYDVHFINELIERHAPKGTLPFPYTMKRPQEYAPLYDVHQRQLGFLTGMAASGTMLVSAFYPDTSIQPRWTKEFWGASNSVAKFRASLTNGPTLPPPVRHPSHMPDDDAYDIAYQMVLLLTLERDMALGRFGHDNPVKHIKEVQ